MEINTTEQFMKVDLTADTANKIRAWLFLNNLAVSFVGFAGLREIKQLYQILIAAYESLEEFDFFANEKLRVFFGIEPSSVEIYKKIMTTDSYPFDKIKAFLNTLIPAKTNKNIAVLANSVSSFQIRFKNLLSLPDEVLISYKEKIEQGFSLYNSDQEANQSILINNIAVENFITVLADGIYLLPPFELESSTEDANTLAGYLNALMDPGHGDGKVISAVVSIDVPVNTSQFDHLFSRLPKMLKNGEIERHPSYGEHETDRFKKVQAMTSFHAQNANYDPDFAAIITEKNDDSQVYEIADTRKKAGTAMGSLKFYTLSTANQRDFHDVIKRLWLLVKTQNIAIQIPKKNSAADYAQAVQLVLVIKLLDTWVNSGFPLTKEQQSKQINDLLYSNKLLGAYLAGDANKTLSEYKLGALRTAYMIYKSMPIINKIIGGKNVSLNEMYAHKYDKPHSNKTQGTPIQEYIAGKTENALKQQTKLKEKNISEPLEHYHKHNITPYDKKIRHQAVQKFIDHCRHGGYVINLRQSVEIAFYLQAALSDAVEYVERKKAVGAITLKQGDAIASLKKTLKYLLRAMMEALSIDPKKQESILNEKRQMAALQKILAYLPEEKQELLIDSPNELNNANDEQLTQLARLFKEEADRETNLKALSENDKEVNNFSSAELVFEEQFEDIDSLNTFLDSLLSSQSTRKRNPRDTWGNFKGADTLKKLMQEVMSSQKQRRTSVRTIEERFGSQEVQLKKKSTSASVIGQSLSKVTNHNPKDETKNLQQQYQELEEELEKLNLFFS